MTARLHSLSAHLDDEGLVARAQLDDEAALEILVRRYRGFSRSKARSYFLVGADADDIEQEGLIGLYKAIRDFRPDRASSFRAFADLCITRQVISAIKSANRNKHQALNQYVSLSRSRSAGEDGGEQCLEDILEGTALDPADEVIGRQQVAAMHRALSASLSSFEVEVLRLYVEGRSYQEIGDRLGRAAKSIDNAIQRIKRKLDVYLRPADGLTLVA